MTNQSDSIQKDTTTLSCVSGMPAILSLISRVSKSDWILDSGASKHICTDLSLLFNIRKSASARVILPDGSVFNVPLIGHVQLSDDILLENVFYVPAFHFNLISDKTLKKIGRGNKIEGLYVLSSDTFTNRIFTDTSNDTIALCNKVSSETWHRRLGHLPISKLLVLKNSSHIVFDNDKYNCFHVCPLAKQRKLPFQSHTQFATSIFDLIHCDIWGPYKVPSHSGDRFFVTIVDDCSRYSWIHMIKHKFS
ncbi:hypothetical protein CASFOL_004384 [Castilleja foliolosa]|uniref:Retrovirus-related Pol polyprotein from transposon TNT 1-94 n=1 Tax=Castilleja foliolosa TaxID=1961234 RepID=A0ABD3ECD0_9LAMI